jgi:tetratricopeptide (TPR) repeat protein
MTFSATTHIARGFDLLFNEHDNDAAIAQFRIALERYKNEVVKSNKEAKRCHPSSKVDHPRMAYAYDLLGHALFRQGQYTTAMSEFRNAASCRSPAVSSSPGRICWTYFSNEQREQSAMEDEWAHYRMGKCYQEAGDFAMAFKYAEETIMMQHQALLRTREKVPNEGICWLRNWRPFAKRNCRVDNTVDERDEDSINQTDDNSEIPEIVLVTSNASPLFSWTTIIKGVLSDDKKVTLHEASPRGQEISFELKKIKETCILDDAHPQKHGRNKGARTRVLCS